jgi:hypothetical protein
MSPSGERHWFRALRYQEKNTDSLQASPKLWALQSLPKLIPQPPFPTLPGDEFVFAQRWHEWIDEHREKLQLLQPTGEGVDFSPTACKDGKPRQQRR